MTPTLPPFYDRYINQCNDVSLTNAFEKYNLSSIFDINKLEQLGDLVYEENKWNVKQILQHCIDTERVMVYRALRFVRNDKTELPGFDQDLYVEETGTSTQSVKELLEEFAVIRESSLLFFKKITEEGLQRKGLASSIEISVEQLGYVILGHVVSHQEILEERYYPLIS